MFLKSMVESTLGLSKELDRTTGRKISFGQKLKNIIEEEAPSTQITEEDVTLEPAG